MSTGAPEDEAQNILSATALPPSHVIDDLLSIGVCVRCILRLFRAHENAYSSSTLTASMLRTAEKEAKSFHDSSDENGLIVNGSGSCSFNSQETCNEEKYCCICLGILQFAYSHDQETNSSFKDRNCVNDFTTMIAEQVKRENHQIVDLCLEVSIPPVILANERAIWLYLKKKYESEDWFKENFFSEHIPVKDALKSAITKSLENLLAVKIGGNSFRIRLTYTHTKASLKVQNFLAKDHGFNRRKTEMSSVDAVEGSLEGTRKEHIEQARSESDAVIRKTLNCLPDHVFCERFELPPQKADQPCCLTTVCYRMPIYIGGRYLKFSRKVSQSRWIIDEERMGEASVEEIIGSKVLLIFRGDTYKFHAAGREDIDVRMLGSGRPFLVEVSNARSLPSSVDLKELADMINGSEDKYVSVRNLKVVGSEAWTLMREGEAEKQKQYAALVWISRPLAEEDLQKISSFKDMDIMQRTPIRVLHRRSPLERSRKIHWMMAEEIIGSSQYFLLHLRTQAGTYIKEFVHGDLGRTHPSIGSILDCRAEILQLDVTDVMMDCFD